MKNIKIITFFFLLFGFCSLVLPSNVFAGTKILSSTYTSLSECNNKVIEYNVTYPDYYRTECFKGDNNAYYYQLCDSESECQLSINNDNEINDLDDINPYASKFNDSVLEILEKIVSKLSSQKDKLSQTKFNNLLKTFDSKLETIKNKKPNNNTIQNLVIYLKYETSKMYINTEIEDFFCELTGECGEEKLQEETQELGCEKFLKIGSISLCDTGKQTQDNQLSSCPTGYRIPTYWEMYYVGNANIKDSGFDQKYWLSSVYSDVIQASTIPPKQGNNRYYITGLNGTISIDMSSYYRLSNINSSSNYNTLCYKGPSISKDFVNNCNLKSTYNYGDYKYNSNSSREKLLLGENLILEAEENKEEKLILSCNGGNLSIKKEKEIEIEKQKQEEKLKEEQLKKEEKEKLQEEANKLGCEKLFKIGNLVTVCDTGKESVFNNKEQYCPEGFKVPNYYEGYYIQDPFRMGENTLGYSKYWINSIYGDVIKVQGYYFNNNPYVADNKLNMNHEANYYGISDKETSYVLCYKGPNLGKNSDLQCKLGGIYNYYGESFNTDRNYLLNGEKLILESKNEQKIELFCNGSLPIDDKLTIKPLNFEPKIELNLSNEKPKVGEKIQISWEGEYVSDCNLSAVPNEKNGVIDPAYKGQLATSIQLKDIEGKIDYTVYYNSSIKISCKTPYSKEKIEDIITVSGVDDSAYVFDKNSRNPIVRLKYMGNNIYTISRLAEKTLCSASGFNLDKNIGAQTVSVKGYKYSPKKVSLYCFDTRGAGQYVARYSLYDDSTFDNNVKFITDKTQIIKYQSAKIEWSIPNIGFKIRNIMLEDLYGYNSISENSTKIINDLKGNINVTPYFDTKYRLSWEDEFGKKYIRILNIEVK